MLPIGSWGQRRAKRLRNPTTTSTSRILLGELVANFALAKAALEACFEEKPLMEEVVASRRPSCLA
jgi:hypothetical protein